MPLTDTECKNAACPADKKRVRLTDGAGLYLEVAATGSKRWFWKFYFDCKEKRLALGNYLAISAKAARLKRDAVRQVQQTGTDPAQQRTIAKLKRRADAVNTFEAVAGDYHATRVADWSKAYGERWLARLVKDVFPWIGALPLVDIKAPTLLTTLRRVEGRGCASWPTHCARPAARSSGTATPSAHVSTTRRRRWVRP